MVVAGAGGRHTFTCEGQLQLPVYWQELVADTHTVVGARPRSMGQGQLEEQWQLCEPWLLSSIPVAGGSHHGCGHNSGGQVTAIVLAV